MPKIDIVNKAVIDKPPPVVFKAILNEHAPACKKLKPYKQEYER